MDAGQGSTAYWRHHGAPAAPALLGTLPQYLDDDAFSPPVMKALAAMGPRAAVDPRTRPSDRFRHRAALHLGDFDAEMRADEQLLQLALATREQITATDAP